MICVLCGAPAIDEGARCVLHVDTLWRGCPAMSDAGLCVLPIEHRKDHMGSMGHTWPDENTSKRFEAFANPSTEGIDTARVVEERIALEAEALVVAEADEAERVARDVSADEALALAAADAEPLPVEVDVMDRLDPTEALCCGADAGGSCDVAGTLDLGFGLGLDAIKLTDE